MARMLGKIETPGCCSRTRSGWYRLRRDYGIDCSGAITSTRLSKREEQRQVRRESALLLGRIRSDTTTD